MPTPKSFVNRHPVLTYFAVVFVISWGGILIILGPNISPARSEEIGTLMPALYLAMMAGPSIAGILLTGVVYGRAGLREFFSHLFRWRVGAHWYALALLTTPLLATVALLLLSATSSDFLPRIYTTEDKGFILQFGIVVGFMVGFIEELGWTGFAVSTLRRHYGIIATGLIVGLVIGVWHAPLVYWTSSGATGVLPPAVYLVAVLFTWLPSYRVLMVCVYDRTESMLVAILMHASLVAFWYILTPLALAGMTLAVFYFVFSAGVWVVVAAVAVGNGGHLARHLLHRQSA